MLEDYGNTTHFGEESMPRFRDFIGENYIMKVFEESVQLPHNNPGFDWVSKKGEKIYHKGTCLSYNRRWIFRVVFNTTADWFILSAWDSVKSLKPSHVWIFHKDQMVRGKRFFRRKTFTVPNAPDILRELEKYEVTDRLGRIKEIYNDNV